MGAAASLGDSSGCDAVRPDQAELGVERVDAVLAAGVVDLGAQVGDRRSSSSGAEGVPQALGEVDRAAVDGVEQHAVPLAERRRADADVDDEVQRRTRPTHVTYLACPGGTSAKWIPRTVPRELDRDVGLLDVSAVADGFGERGRP